MTLKEFQNVFKIKRIDFSKVKESKYDTEYATDRAICPYCKKEIEIADDYDEVLRGTTIQCPHCGKYFAISAEISIETTSTPIETAVLNNENYIKGTYAYMDSCEEKGIDFPSNRWNSPEWKIYDEFARPLFENEENEA